MIASSWGRWLVVSSVAALCVAFGWPVPESSHSTSGKACGTAPSVIYADVNRELADGIVARGVVMLSAPLRSHTDPPRDVRVLATHVVIHRDGRPFITFKAAPAVDAESRAADMFPSAAVYPAPPAGVEVVSRDSASARCELMVRPAGDLTWGEVSEAGQIQIDLRWSGTER